MDVEPYCFHAYIIASLTEILLPIDSFKTTGSGNPLTSFEVAFRIRFAYLEKFLDGNFFRISLGSPYPIGEINITQRIFRRSKEQL